jgi:hypothetical protein
MAWVHRQGDGVHVRKSRRETGAGVAAAPVSAYTASIASNIASRAYCILRRGDASHVSDYSSETTHE